METILKGVKPDKDFLRINHVIYGKTVKKIPLKSKNTLTKRELHQYMTMMMNVYKFWETRGDPDWIVTEIEGVYFTLKFIRKGSMEHDRYLERIKNGD